MPSKVTPSAKAHERVSGRWTQDIDVKGARERVAFYMKSLFGTPIPWLMLTLVVSLLVTRAGLEISSSAIAVFTFIYLLADRVSRTKEFQFFRVGSDLALLGFAAVAIVTIVYHHSIDTAYIGLGQIRWIFLLYLFSFSFELFPGINRLFFLLVAVTVATSGYAIAQHFTGLDVFRGGLGMLPFAPIKGQSFFVANGFFRSPEIFGTLLAMIIPFSAAAFLYSENRSFINKSLSLLATLTITLAALWTYRPGLWMAAIAGLVIVMLIVPRRQFWLILFVGLLIGTTLLVTYDNPQALVDQLKEFEATRSTEQRGAINEHVALFKQDPWFGVGVGVTESRKFDITTGNVYFQLLSQTGALGLGFYLVFILGFLLMTYQLLREVPASHYWHRVFVAASLGSQVAFHASGLYWSTLQESHAMVLFVLVLAAVGYIREHYSRGLVPDDSSL